MQNTTCFVMISCYKSLLTSIDRITHEYSLCRVMSTIYFCELCVVSSLLRVQCKAARSAAKQFFFFFITRRSRADVNRKIENAKRFCFELLCIASRCTRCKRGIGQKQKELWANSDTTGKCA